MAIEARELKKWLLENVLDHEMVAIDDGGLTMVVVCEDGTEAIDTYFEIGGVPEKEPETVDNI